MKGHIRKRGKSSWAIVFDLGREPDGRRRQRWHSIKGTKRDAERELARLLHEFNTGAYVEPVRMPMSEFLERWLTDYAVHAVSAKTLERYTEIVRNHLSLSLGHHSLQKLQPLHIQGYYSDALKSGRMNGRGGLSAQTVLHHHRVLHGALKPAVRWQLLVRNSADAVEPPRPSHKEMRALDEEGTVQLLKSANGSRLYRPIFVAVTTGLRRGELLALRWSVVDLDRGILSIQKVLEQTRGGLAFKQPKTARSRRAVELAPLTINELKRHRKDQAQHRLLMGSSYANQDLVFPEPDGRPWGPNKLSSAFAALMRRTGFKGFRFHDLRHSHATQLLKQGIHPKIVSERLGHGTIAITLDTYSHVLPGLQKEAADRIDIALRDAFAAENRKT